MASHHQTMPLRQALIRSCAEEGSVRAVPFSDRCFYVYRVVENGRTYPLVVDCSSLEEAVEGGKVHCFHKEQLVVREVASGTDRLHIYAIKKRSAPTYVYRNHDYQRQDRLFAAPVCVIDMRMLAGGGE
jgi:hypothetical protein